MTIYGNQVNGPAYEVAPGLGTITPQIEYTGFDFGPLGPPDDIELNYNLTERVTILTGRGDTFCAGMDLAEIGKLRSGVSDNPWIERVRKEPQIIYGAWLKTYRPTKPVILAAEGFARAGGTEILQGTDIRVAGESAKFGVTEVQRGLFPMAGSAVRLRRQIPYAIAAEMLLAGDDLPARRAYELGLVNHVVPDGQALAKAPVSAESAAPPCTTIHGLRSERPLNRSGIRVWRCAAAGKAPRPHGRTESSDVAVA